MRKSSAVIIFVVFLLAGAPALAEIVDSAPGGFTVRHSVTSAFSAERTWAMLVDIGNWWDPDHTFSGRADNLSLTPQPQGCFCETLPGGGAVHGTVLYAHPGRLLRIQTSLGPLQEHGATGVLSFVLSTGDTGGTRIEVTYRVGGYLAGGLNVWATPVDRVLGEQVTRLSQRLGQSGRPR